MTDAIREGTVSNVELSLGAEDIEFSNVTTNLSEINTMIDAFRVMASSIQDNVLQVVFQ